MRDAAGRFVAEPLRNGGSFCTMHTILFPRKPARAWEAIVAYIDLETNSLDVLSGRILEVGALVDGSRAMFSTIVDPGNDAHLDVAFVHGIARTELLCGPSFAEAFGRLDEFLRYASLSVLESDEDSEDGRTPTVTKKESINPYLGLQLPLANSYLSCFFLSCGELALGFPGARYSGHAPARVF